MIYPIRLTCIIPQELRDNANSIAMVLDPGPGGETTFRTPVAEQATPTVITGYVASVPLKAEYAALLTDPDASGMHAALQQLAVARGRSYMLTLEQAQAVRDGLEFSNDSVSAVLLATGRQFVVQDSFDA